MMFLALPKPGPWRDCLRLLFQAASIECESAVQHGDTERGLGPALARKRGVRGDRVVLEVHGRIRIEGGESYS
jgi:hypothetical protein